MMQNQPPPSTPRRKTVYKWWIDSDPPYHLPTLRAHRLSGKTWAEIAKDSGGTVSATHLARFYRRHYGKVAKEDLEKLRCHHSINPTKLPDDWDIMSNFSWGLLQIGDSPTKVAKYYRDNGWKISTRAARAFVDLWLIRAAELTWGKTSEEMLEIRRPKPRSKPKKESVHTAEETSESPSKSIWAFWK